MFFFAKKNQKTLFNKSFLLLFFKKEVPPSFLLGFAQ